MDFFQNQLEKMTTKTNNSSNNSTQNVVLPTATEYTQDYKQKYEFMKNLECATKEMTTNFMIQLQPTTAGRRKFNQSSGISSFVTGARFGGTSNTPQHETKLSDMMLEQANALGDSLLADCLRESSSYYNFIGTSKDELDDDIKNHVFSAWFDLQKQVIQRTRDNKKEMESAKKRYDGLHRDHVRDPIKVEKYKVDNTKAILVQKAKIMKESLDDVSRESQSTASQLLHLVKAQRLQAQKQAQYLAELENKLEQRISNHQAELADWDCLELDGDSTKNNTVALDFNERNAGPIDFNQNNNGDNEFQGEWSEDEDNNNNSFGLQRHESIRPNRPTIKRERIKARALYDFDAENAEELRLQQGDIIENVTQLDENWYNGDSNGRSGYFPVNYVEIIN